MLQLSHFKATFTIRRKYNIRPIRKPTFSMSQIRYCATPNLGSVKPLFSDPIFQSAFPLFVRVPIINYATAYQPCLFRAYFPGFAILFCMTKLLDEAIEQLRDLPADDQDGAADVLFAYISSDERQYRLRPHQVAEVQRIRRALRDGTTRLATNAEVTEAKKKARI
jgi:hypothetical protein